MPIQSHESLKDFFENQATVISPPFPNWQRSFISGTDSPLFVIEHRIGTTNPHVLLSRVTFKPKAEGPPNHVHGGASAALIDESMGIAVWHNQFVCLTQNLDLTYLRALPLTTVAYMWNEISKISEKTIEVHCTIFDEKKTPYVSAQGVFHRLTLDQLKKFAT